MNKRGLTLLVSIIALAVTLAVLRFGSPSASSGERSEVRSEVSVTASNVSRSVFIDSNVSGGKVEVNGTIYTLPVKLDIPIGTFLVIRPLPVSVYEPVQSEIKFSVLEDRIVEIHYRKKYVTVNITAVAPVVINGTVFSGSASLTVKVNSTLSLNSTCSSIGNYTVICSDTIVIERGNVEEYYSLNISLRILNDTSIRVSGGRFLVFVFNFPIGVLVNGSYVEGRSKLICPENSTIEIRMTRNGNSPAGCRNYNYTHYECIKEWIVPSWLANKSLPPTLLRFRARYGGEIGERIDLVSKYSLETVVLCSDCAGFKRVEDPFYDYRKVFGSADRYNVSAQAKCLTISTDAIARLFVVLPRSSGRISLKICTRSWHNSFALLYLSGGLYINVPSFTLQGGCYNIVFDLDYAKAYFEGKLFDASKIVVSGLDVVEYSFSTDILSGQTRVLPNTGEFALDVYLQGEYAEICLNGEG